MDKVIKSAVNTLTIEAEAIYKLISKIDDGFVKAVDVIFNLKGRLIITGMGKSGVIGMKLAATFSSTGTPAFFLHPGEAIHGDLGMIRPEDIILAISYSGETDELLKIIPFLKDYSSGVIAMTGKPESTLAKYSDTHICVHVDQEACPNNLAPTASTTATLAMGDAIAIAVVELKDFKAEQFARYHPGGNLGRKLLTKVNDVMHANNLPIVESHSTIKEVINKISYCRLGLVIVRQKGSDTPGIITDGDLRRAMENNQEGFFSLKARDIMTENAMTISSSSKLIEAEKIMTQAKITALIVKEDDDIVGVIQIYDIQ